MTSTNVLDHGYVSLVDRMGNDLSIVNAARTSFNSASGYHEAACSSRLEREGECSCNAQYIALARGIDDARGLSIKDAGLINFLMRERHGTPFEMVQFQFEVAAPIFVVREWMRHRIGSFNEMSGRYTQLERKFYVPARDDIREQVGKPGSYTYERMRGDWRAAEVMGTIQHVSEAAFDAYEGMLELGVAKEVARLVLPVNTYSKFVWSINLRALMNFLSLRADSHAQKEIRVYAEAIVEMAKKVAPVAMESWEKSGRIAP